MTTVSTNRLIDHLRKAWGEFRKCPMCEHNLWDVSGTIFELREYHEGNIVIGTGPVLPIIPVTCTNCGNTVFLNAVATGFVKKQGQNA
jgi:hypothetical protein